MWTTRRWIVAAGASVVSALALGLPTDVIPNPVFGRQGTPVTWWSYPVLAVTAVLSGMLFATYVRNTPDFDDHQLDQPGRTGGFGALLSFFAIGCPICNKVVLLALGAAGAVKWFAPVQPFLGAASLLLMGWALWARLRGEVQCPIPNAS